MNIFLSKICSSIFLIFFFFYIQGILSFLLFLDTFDYGNDFFKRKSLFPRDFVVSVVSRHFLKRLSVCHEKTESPYSKDLIVSPIPNVIISERLRHFSCFKTLPLSEYYLAFLTNPFAYLKGNIVENCSQILFQLWKKSYSMPAMT